MRYRVAYVPLPGLVALTVLALLAAGCASVRPTVPVTEIPAGTYEASMFLAMAPTLAGDGEIVAAVLYALPGGRRIEVRDNPRNWLLTRPIGPATGKEHLELVKSGGNYQAVRLPGPDGQPLAYAVLHRRVHGGVQDWANNTSALFLSTLYFIDPNYIKSDGSRNGR